jgi:hypothetical protein
MKKSILSIFSLLILGNAYAQSTDTVSVGAGYANQVWYNLETGTKTSQPKNNWDLAFEINGFSASILANTVGGVSLWTVPGKLANETDFAAIDTTGMTAWSKLYNSDTTWSVGAFNHNPANDFDLGWGIYNMDNHVITGDSLFVIKLSNGTYKKLWIINLAAGVYNFRYADLNGSNDVTASIAKASYTNKNFGYYSIVNGAAIDREPNADDFDLLFTQYASWTYNPPYTVTGVLLNKNIEAIRAEKVDINTVSPDFYPYVTNISTIGWNWKKLNGSMTGYDIEDSLAFFVKTQSEDVYKIIFTGFGGSANGNFVFEKEKLATSGIFNSNKKSVAVISVYPNPANNQDVTLLYSVKTPADNAFVSVYDITGRMISRENVNANSTSLSQHTLNTTNLQAGMYIVSFEINGQSAQQKLIIE